MRTRAAIDAAPQLAQISAAHLTMAPAKILGSLAVMAVQTERDTSPPASGRLIPRPGPGERIAAVALVVAALAIAAQFAWQQHHSPAPVPAPASASAAAPVPIGAVDAPSSEAIVGTAVHIFGWALDSAGI